MSDLTLRVKINASPFIRGMHDLGTVSSNMAADIIGKPRPPRKPYPKAHSGMTARQYRAARRAYGRARRAHRKAMQHWTPDQPRMGRTLAAFVDATIRANRRREGDRDE